MCSEWRHFPINRYGPFVLEDAANTLHLAVQIDMVVEDAAWIFPRSKIAEIIPLTDQRFNVRCKLSNALYGIPIKLIPFEDFMVTSLLWHPNRNSIRIGFEK